MSEQSDPFGALSTLAPTVDMAASRELFERSRSARPRVGHRWLLPAAVVALLVAGVVGVWASARNGGSPTVPGTQVDGEESSGTVYSLLYVTETSGAPGTVDVATDLESLRSTLAPVVAPVDVTADFDRSIVAVFNVFGNACPLDVDRFDVDGATWTLMLAAGDEACDDIGVTWAYVVAIDRGALGPVVEFRSVLDDTEAADMDRFDVVAVEETVLPFGTIRAATDEAAYDEMWSDDLPGVGQPPIDFERQYVVSFTLPDDACPDRLVQFIDGEGAAERRIVRQPVFEPPPGGCDQPLITRTYVVAIARPLVDAEITFQLPGEDIFDYPQNEVTVAVDRGRFVVRLDGASAEPDAPNEPDLVATDVRLPLPSVGEPQLHTGTFGIIWVVHHEDGTVSVLDAVVPEESDEDEGGVEGLGYLVRPTETGDGFAGRQSTWDAHGRTTNGPRTADLIGYAGNVVDGEVQLFRSTATRFDGEAEPLDTGEVGSPDLSNIPLLDLEMLPTLSFLGPIWRQLDATLVVEGGVGTLCPIDQTLPVPDLATCDDGLATSVTSSDAAITNWFFGPVLAEFDEFGNIVTVAPLGGRASRNDGADGVVSSIQPSGDGWRQLARFPSQVPDAPVMLAFDEDSFAEMGSVIGMMPLPDADFETSVVATFTVASSPCLPPLATVISPDRGVIEPAFEPAFEPTCRASLQWFTFLVEINRSEFDGTVRVSVPETVDSLAGALDTTPIHDATFRIDDGVLTAGGLSIPDRVSAICTDTAGPALSVPVASIGTRSFRLEYRVAGNIVWEADGLGDDVTLTASLDVEGIPPGVGEVIATSTVPPAEFRRPFSLSRTDLDDLIAECG